MFTRADAAAFAGLARCHATVGDRPRARRALAAACHLATDDHRPAGERTQALAYRRTYAIRAHRAAIYQEANS